MIAGGWLLLGLLAHAGEPTWARHHVPDHPVSVELPGTVKHRHGERSMIIGTVVSETLVVEWEQGWAAATVTRIPPFASHLATESNIFGTTRKSVLEEQRATLGTWEDTRAGALRGKRMTYAATKDGPRQGVSEIYTWDDKVATFTAVYDPVTTPPGAVERFFASIRIGPPP